MQRSEHEHLSLIRTAPRAGCIYPSLLWFFLIYPSLFNLPSEGCISVLRVPIGQFRFFFFFFFWAQSNLCVKWQYMNQVTGKGGRLGHFSGPGEGVLKQKAAPGFQGESRHQLFHHLGACGAPWLPAVQWNVDTSAIISTQVGSSVWFLLSHNDWKRACGDPVL